MINHERKYPNFAEIEKQAREAKLVERDSQALSKDALDIKMQNEVMKIKSSEAEKYKEHLGCSVHINSALERYLNMLEELEQDLCISVFEEETVCRIESKFVPQLASAKKRIAELEELTSEFESEEALVSQKIKKITSGKEHKEIFDIMLVFERHLVKNLILKAQLAMEDFSEEFMNQNFNILIGKAKEDRTMAGKLLACQHKLSDEIEHLKREAHQGMLLAVGVLTLV